MGGLLWGFASLYVFLLYILISVKVYITTEVISVLNTSWIDNIPIWIFFCHFHSGVPGGHLQISPSKFCKSSGFFHRSTSPFHCDLPDSSILTIRTIRLQWPCSFFNCILGGGTGSTRHVGHWMAYCTWPRWLLWCREFGGMKIGRGNRSTRRKPTPAPLCPPQIHLPDPGSNPGRRGGKPATNRLSYGAAGRAVYCACDGFLKIHDHQFDSRSNYVCMYYSQSPACTSTKYRPQSK
jgi:hypothetical protein